MISRIVAYVAAILTCTLASNAYARQWYVEPSVFLAPGYEDNPFLLTDAESEDIEGEPVDDRTPGGQYLTFFGGNFRLGSETETDLIAFDALGSARQYEDSILDTEDLIGRIVYQKTGEKNDWGLETGYQQTSSISTYGDPFGGVGVDEFGRFRDDLDQEVLFFRPTFTSRFSSNWLGELDFLYRDVSFDEPLDTTVEYEDFRTAAGLRRVVSERLSLVGFLNLLFYRPKETVGLALTEKENAGDLQFGVDYIINDRFSILLTAGPGYVNTFVADSGGTIEIDDTSPIYTARVEYRGQRNTITIDGYSGYESFIDTGVAKTERITFTHSRPQTLGGELGFDVFYIDRGASIGDSFESTYLGGAAHFTWDFNNAFSVSVRAEYRDQDRVETFTGESANADTSAIFITGAYDWGRKLIKQ